MAQFLHPSTVLPRKAEANGPEASAGDAESEAFREAAVDVLCTLGRPGYASSAQCMVIVRFLTVHAFFQCTDASSKVRLLQGQAGCRFHGLVELALNLASVNSLQHDTAPSMVGLAAWEPQPARTALHSICILVILAVCLSLYAPEYVAYPTPLQDLRR